MEEKNFKQIIESKLTGIEAEISEIRERLWESGAQNMSAEEEMATEIRREALELERDEILTWLKVQNTAEDGGIEADIERKIQMITINVKKKR